MGYLFLMLFCGDFDVPHRWVVFLMPIILYSFPKTFFVGHAWQKTSVKNWPICIFNRIYVVTTTTLPTWCVVFVFDNIVLVALAMTFG